MAVVIKRMDGSVPVGSRSVTFIAGTDFVQDDIIDINSSISGAGQNVTIEVAAGASCTVQVNPVYKRYPLLGTAKSLNYPAPDLQSETTVTQPNPLTYVLTAGEILDLNGVMNLIFTAVSGVTTVTVRS